MSSGDEPSREQEAAPVASFVVPCFNEQETIGEFYKRCATVADSLPSYQFEFNFVNDGSNDRTAELLNQLADRDARVRVLHLARNCGHQIAITAGLDFASGDVIITIDADLQDPPELVGEMLEKIERGCDIVHAQRRKRAGETRFKLLTAGLFYNLMNFFATSELVRNSGDFRALTRPVLEAARRFREPHRFLRGLFSTIGFRQTIVQYDRDARYAGTTKYPLLKMVRLALNALLSFSTTPLRFITGVALMMWLASLVYIAHALYQHFIMKTTVTGWTSLAILITFSTGLTLFCLNILGAYIGRIYEQGLNRPLYWLNDIRNVDVINTPPYIGDSKECQLSLSVLRSRGGTGRTPHFEQDRPSDDA